jgi:hypothetical protein
MGGGGGRLTAALSLCAVAAGVQGGDALPVYQTDGEILFRCGGGRGGEGGCLRCIDGAGKLLAGRATQQPPPTSDHKA